MKHEVEKRLTMVGKALTMSEQMTETASGSSSGSGLRASISFCSSHNRRTQGFLVLH